MTLCWDDYKTRAMFVLPLAPVAVGICVLLLARTVFLLLDTINTGEYNDVYSAMRLILNIIPGLFAIFALVGLATANAPLTKAGAVGMWPVILTIFLSCGLKWWILLARDIAGANTGNQLTKMRVKPTDAEWSQQWANTALEVVLTLALLYAITIFKRIANLYQRGGNPWRSVQTNRLETDAVEMAAPQLTSGFPAGGTVYYGQDNIVQPVFHALSNIPGPRLTQRVLDTLDSIVVIRANDNKSLLDGYNALRAVGLLYQLAPTYFHVPTKPIPEGGFSVTLYKGTRSKMIDLKMGTCVKEYMDFFEPVNKMLDAEERAQGFINADVLQTEKFDAVLYVKSDCVYCTHMKPLAVSLNKLFSDPIIRIFDVGTSDFPQGTPVVRAVPQLWLSGCQLLPLIDTNAFKTALLNLPRIRSSETARKLALEYCCCLPIVYNRYLTSAKQYYESILPAQVDHDELEDRANLELLMNNSPLDAMEYLKWMESLAVEFDATSNL